MFKVTKCYLEQGKGALNMEQICPKCATGTSPWRDGIMCRNYVCARDDAGNRGADILKDLPPGFAEIFRGFGANGQC